MQMPSSEQLKLSQELQMIHHKPSAYTLDEINARIDEAEDDIANGRVFAAEEMHSQLEQKHPWLCN